MQHWLQTQQQADLTRLFSLSMCQLCFLEQQQQLSEQYSLLMINNRTLLLLLAGGVL